MTQLQAETAEEHFSILFEPYPWAEDTGQILQRTVNGHSCLWVPTPSDYVNGKGDYEGMVQRLTKAKENGDILSFFFHPVVDEAAQVVTVSGDSMSFSYLKDQGVLPRLLDLVESWGYQFGSIASLER